MVLIAINNDNNNKLIHAHHAYKGNYTCNFCNEKIFFINESINRKTKHFRHTIQCKYSKAFNNSTFDISEFHFKWTRDFVRPKYLYNYWNNTDIADVININNIKIIIKNNLLKKTYYENIIWILNGEYRK
jgi:hypothetical protein